MNRRQLWIPLLGPIPFLMLAGCGGGNVYPSINSPQVSHSQVRFEGGSITISADVQHGFPVKSAWAEIRQPDGTTRRLPLVQTQGNRYEASFAVPLNANANGQSQVYTVWIRAESYDGHVTPPPGEPEAGLTVEVQAPPSPPPPAL